MIGVPPHWTAARVDAKLTALLRKHRPAYFTSRVRGLDAEEEPAAA